tara:strand:+ start:185 stop:868 length:684 start_codon:yes stop_codon:yes gene_type:complete
MMARKVTNRRVGPKNREHPAGKHKSLLQDVTYNDSIDHPMTADERVRMQKEFQNMGVITKPFDLPTMLEKYRTIAITYLDDSGIEYKECDGWEWGHTLTDEYKAAAQINGGFVAAFKALNTVKQIENRLKKGDMEKAIAYSLHLGLYTRNIVKSEMEPLYHAGVKQTEAANHDKSQVTNETIEMARPVFHSYLDKGQSKTNAGKLTSKYLMEEHGISKSPNTVRLWF